MSSYYVNVRCAGDAIGKAPESVEGTHDDLPAAISFCEEYIRENPEVEMCEISEYDEVEEVGSDNPVHYVTREDVDLADKSRMRP